MGSSAGIITLAKRSGLPYIVGSTFRPGSVTKSGNRSHHADDNAVDFMGYSQDELAEYFMQFDTLEVFHKSQKTGKWYGKSRGKLVDEATHQELVKDHVNHMHVAMSPEQVASVSDSPSLLDRVVRSADPLGLTDTVQNPFESFTAVAKFLTSPFWWRRIGMAAMGSAFIMVGLIYINRRPLQQGVQAVAGLAGTAIQGVAFGAGAGATGGGAAVGRASAPDTAPVTAVPARKGPRPPMINAPTTSILPEAYAPISAGGTYQVTTARGVAKRPSAPLPDSSGGGSARAKKKRKGTQAGVSMPFKSGPYSKPGE